MKSDVILYIPNLIGYLRLLLLFGSIMFKDMYFMAMYAASVSLDYFDGYAARFFNQKSKLGACLDMVTDRVSTTILCFKIIEKKPHHLKVCAFYIFFDFVSHFIYFVSMVYNNTHHKEFMENPMVALYYYGPFLKVMCVGSELYFLTLYYEEKKKIISKYLIPIPIIKTFFHIVHLVIGISKMSEVAYVSNSD